MFSTISYLETAVEEATGYPRSRYCGAPFRSVSWIQIEVFFEMKLKYKYQAEQAWKQIELKEVSQNGD